MSKIKNGGLDQYGAEPFEQQQFGTAGLEGVNLHTKHLLWEYFYLQPDSNNILSLLPILLLFVLLPSPQY